LAYAVVERRRASVGRGRWIEDGMVTQPFVQCVRPARTGDAEFILELCERLPANFAVPPWRTPAEVVSADQAAVAAAIALPQDDQAVLVAEGPDGPAGFAYLVTLVDYFSRRPHAHLSILAVSAAAEGRGVGRALLQAAEDWARARGHDAITLHVFVANERARALYERVGYAAETIRYVKPLPAEPDAPA